jgi:hypothetical protein
MCSTVWDLTTLTSLFAGPEAAGCGNIKPDTRAIRRLIFDEGPRCVERREWQEVEDDYEDCEVEFQICFSLKLIYIVDCHLKEGKCTTAVVEQGKPMQTVRYHRKTTSKSSYRTEVHMQMTKSGLAIRVVVKPNASMEGPLQIFRSQRPGIKGKDDFGRVRADFVADFKSD